MSTERTPSSYSTVPRRHVFFHGPEDVRVALNEKTHRVEVLEGELAGRRFSSPQRAAVAILNTYQGFLMEVSNDELCYPSRLWSEVPVGSLPEEPQSQDATEKT